MPIWTALPALLLCLAYAATPVQAQNTPSLDTVSIKRNTSGSSSSSSDVQPGRVTITNTSVHNLIRNLYNVADFQLVGGPDWLRRERYDVLATMTAPPTRAQLPALLQGVLTDRFKLTVRRETREVPIYVLIRARADGRLGPRIRPTTLDCAAAGRGAAGGPPCGFEVSDSAFQATGRAIDVFTRALAQLVGRPVIDQTGLQGLYDLDLAWTQESPVDAGGAPTDSPSFFTALQEQLGLKLDARRGPADVLVIESVERPNEN
jgi:uncharacterized protein (TIGR03435 family)